MAAIQTNIVVPTLCVHSPLDSTAKLNYTYRNKVINGAFSIWQRAVSFALASAAYTADRWCVSMVGNVARESFLPGESELMDNSPYYLKTNPTTSAAAYIEQRIENVATLAGKQTTLTFWAKSGISGSSMPITIVQNFGTTLGVSADVAVTTVVGAATLTPAWTKHTMTITLPSIAGKTVGVDGNDYVAIRFTLPIDDVSLCNVQWEQGPLATDFELRPISEELRLCRRYYEQWEFADQQLTMVGFCLTTDSILALLRYETKRATPTITIPATIQVFDVGIPLATTWATVSAAPEFAEVSGYISGVFIATGNAAIARANAASNLKIDAEL